ncbi:MAG: hypothetical protein ACO38V_06145, partial [Phycisphaerales bacterium]
MKSLNGVAVAAAWSVLALGGIAHAQEAVQWRVEDGGNGHWYSKLIWQEPVIWEVARALAADAGADLVSIALSAEQDWVSTAMDLTHEPCPGYVGWFIGAYQDLEAANYQEPADGWRWSDGEPWSWTNWASHAPDNWAGTQHWGMMYD